MIKIKSKILYFLLLVFVILAMIFNANNFVGFFQNALGNYYFSNLDYKNALNYHKKAENNIKNNTINYNLGGDYYKLGDYTKSKEHYKKIKTATGEKSDLDMDYNLGNAFYKLGEKNPNVDEKVSLWKQSLGSYKKVLDEKEDIKTRQNYDFVEKKLKQLEQNQEKNDQEQQSHQQEQNQDDSNQEKGDSSDAKNDSNNDKKEEDSKKDGESKQDESAKEENKSGQGNKYDIKKDSQIKELTEEEKKQLEEYNEQLKQEQKENSNLFGKKDQSNNQDIFEMLKQDPLFGNFENFDNSILNSNEEDW